MPRPGQVLGLVGTNGIGKSTALKILAGKMKPNLGRYETPPDWEEILVHFRGSELQNYFTKILEDTMKATIKPQYVDHIPRAVKGEVGKILKTKDDVGPMKSQFVPANGDTPHLTKSGFFDNTAIRSGRMGCRRLGHHRFGIEASRGSRHSSSFGR